jgi:hypothetical protein
MTGTVAQRMIFHQPKEVLPAKIAGQLSGMGYRSLIRSSFWASLLRLPFPLPPCRGPAVARRRSHSGVPPTSITSPLWASSLDSASADAAPSCSSAFFYSYRESNATCERVGVDERGRLDHSRYLVVADLRCRWTPPRR